MVSAREEVLLRTAPRRAQARAILEAAVNVAKEGVKVHPHIMIPLVGIEDELVGQAKIVNEVAASVFKAAGSSVAAAFHEIYFLERACQAQIQAMSAGVALNIPNEEVCRHTAAQFGRDGIDGIIDMAWQAALSLIDAQRSEWCS